MKQILAIAGKELKTYFGTPMAAIFIGLFLLSSLFSFFWLETFFARNIADIRPLFRWMPLLMIFLVAALTMRQWSEEQKMGTLEVLLTLPVRIHQLVIGKFLAVLALTSLALFLTLGLPVTVAMIGNLDWGPVTGGYLGAVLMAAAYISIGLFVSSRTDNQIIALMLTVLVAGFFYLIGSSGITDFFGNRAGELLRSLGTGSRFASIERGVIDLRDVVYYLTLALFFLAANIYTLDRKRWSFSSSTASYRRGALAVMVLVGLNLLFTNIWLARVNATRIDLTEKNEYSLSPATRDLITNLAEPLTLRGYFSAKTHPLLAPLVPRIKDMMTEYAIASDGRVRVFFVDPKTDEEMEAEANQQYGIKPVPFQVAGRYEAAVVNSYFHILVKYGDQYETLGFEDLIEIKPMGDGQLDVSLRNLEYDLTKTIKKVVYGFQSLAAVFDESDKDFTLISIVTPETLPEAFAEMPERIARAANELVRESGGRLVFEELNPDPADPQTDRDLNQRFGITPMAASFFSDQSFYLHLILKTGEVAERVYLSPDMTKAEIRQEIEGVIKRSGSGFLKTIGIWTPPAGVSPHTGMMQQAPRQDSYQIFQQILGENYNLQRADLLEGHVSSDIDVLLLVAPAELTDLQRFSVDQYLMRGGAVVALAGNYLLDLTPYSQSLKLKKVQSGLTDLLDHYGVTVADSLVMDEQNEPFPIPVARDLGGMIVQEIRQIDYPFFVDVRSDGMDGEHPITASLPAVTLNWVSPISLDRDVPAASRVTTLLRSSPRSWLVEDPDIEPDFDRYPGNGFAPGDDFEPRKLAVAITGSFISFFRDKEDPRLNREDGEEALDEGEANGHDHTEEEQHRLPPQPLIKKSPDTARLVVVGSTEFINDNVIRMSQSMGMDRFLNSLEFVQNIIDWSVAEEDLLSIRSRGSHARLLKPLSREEQRFWEWFNYGIALAALLFVSIYGAGRRRREKPLELAGGGRS